MHIAVDIHEWRDSEDVREYVGMILTIQKWGGSGNSCEA